jgi:predicted metalloprotease with PDZ domain
MYKHFVTAAALAILAVGTQALPAQDPADSEHSGHQGAKPYLGVMIGAHADQGQAPGVSIAAVSPNSPAANAGLKAGDTITAVENQPVKNFEDLQNILARHHVGDKLTFQVMHNGEHQTLSVTLRPRPANWDQERQEGTEEEEHGRFRRPPAGHSGDDETDQDRGRSEEGRFQQRGRGTAFLGVQTRELTPELRSQRGIEAKEGVLVTEVVPGSPAEKAGLRAGDVITEVGDQEISSPQDLRQAVHRAGPGHRLTMEIQRGSRQRQVTARLESGPVDFGMPPGQRSYGRFSDQEEEMAPGGQTRELRRLERRIQQLERRIRELERQNSNGSSR